MLLNKCWQAFTFICIYFIISTLLWKVAPKPEGHYDIDSYGYDAIAWHFANTGTLTDPNSLDSAPVQPVGYPFFIGVLFWLFGHTVFPVIVVQIVLMLCVLLAIIYSAYTFFNCAVACIAGMLCLSCVGFYVYPQFLLAETILLAVLVLFIERYLTFLKDKNVRALYLSGLYLGVSMIIKPVAILLVFFLALLTWFALDAHKIKRVSLFLLCFFIPLTTYMTRNYMLYGYFAFAPMAQLNLYQVLLAKVIGSVERKDPQGIIDTKLRFIGENSLDTQGWQPAKKLFYIYLKKHPFIFMRIWLVNVCKTWLGLYSTQLKRLLDPKLHKTAHSFFIQSGSLAQRIHHYIVGGTSHKWVEHISWFEFLWSIVRLLLAIVGLYVVFKMNHLIGWFFVVMIVSLSFPTGIDGCCRYRIVFEPILIMAASIGMWKVYILYITKRKGVSI